MSLELENKFISYLMHDTKYIAQVSDTLTRFHLPKTYNVYKLVNLYFKKYKGIIQEDYAIEYLKRWHYDNSIILNYQETMLEISKYNHFDDAEFEAILAELDIDYKKASLLDIASKIIDKSTEGLGGDILEKFEQEIQKQAQELSIDRDNVKGINEISETVEKRYEHYMDIKTHPEKLVLYPTGFKGFDNKNGGFAPGELIYAIGRQGSGKSVFLVNLAHNFWEQGFNVVLFSLEINEMDYNRRFDSRAAGVSTNGLKRGTLTEREEKVYIDYLHKLKEGKSLNNKPVGKIVIVDVPGLCTPAFIENKVNDLEKEYNTTFQIVISDYAGIMQPTIRQKEVRHNKAQIALELKQYARKYGKVVVTAEQMNRSGKASKSPESDAIAESDAVGNHIDWGMALVVTDEYNGQVIGFKTRDGEPFTIYFRREFNIMLMSENDDATDWSQLDKV